MAGDSFQKGDIAICVNNIHATKILTIGKEYLVKTNLRGQILIENDHGFSGYFIETRFRGK